MITDEEIVEILSPYICLSAAITLAGYTWRCYQQCFQNYNSLHESALKGYYIRFARDRWLIHTTGILKHRR